MSDFVTAMDSVAPTPLPLDKRLGENGSPEYSAEGVQNPLVAIFFALVRGMERPRLDEMLDSILAMACPDRVADAMVLAFQTRNCRGGKGERVLFYWMILHLHKMYPATTTEMLKLIPHYGSYKDWFQIAALADGQLQDAILSIAAAQLRKDQQILASTDSGKSALSLVAKWAPREKGANHQQASILAKKLFPNSTTANRQYRQLVSSLNKVLDTTEVKMCANDWPSIDFASVPSLAMLKYRKAFLNEKIGTVPAVAEDATGNRFPDNMVRVQCRERLRQELLTSELKGKQLFPHEIVFQKKTTSTLETDLLQLQWNDIRKNVKESMSKVRKSEGGEQKVDLGNMVAIADVSGSMDGIPMMVSIALSILVSELAAPAFANRFLTFSEEPSWMKFGDNLSLKQKVMATQNAPWGFCTDFEKAMDLVLKTAVNAKLTPSSIPDLIVFSDMQFDNANSGGGDWDTAHERLVKKYAQAGMKACGEPWTPPHIIFWNLRGDTCGFPAQADAEGVTMLSGFSPSLLKLLLDGEPLEGDEVVSEIIDEDGDVVLVKEKAKKTPYDTVRKVLDDTAYDRVREILSRSNEGLLGGYEFQPTACDDVASDWVMEA
jgi:Domain of unknown function (DUF2828)